MSAHSLPGESPFWGNVVRAIKYGNLSPQDVADIFVSSGEGMEGPTGAQLRARNPHPVGVMGWQTDAGQRVIAAERDADSTNADEFMQIAREEAERAGIPFETMRSALGTMLKEAGVAEDLDVKEAADAFAVLDGNKDGRLSAEEIKAINISSIFDKIVAINPTFARLFRDPNFRLRIIERPEYESIYGPREGDQSQLVQVAEASYLDNSNEFNTAFS